MTDARDMADAFTATRWAVLRTDGYLFVADKGETEAEAWRVALGWPSPEEIEDAKRRGARAFRIAIHEVPPDE